MRENGLVVKRGGASESASPVAATQEELVDFGKRCQEFVDGVGEENREWNAFNIAKSIAIGYQGVKPAEKLEALKFMAMYGKGRPPETVVMEHRDTRLKGMSDKELIFGLFASEENMRVLRELLRRDGVGEQLKGMLGLEGEKKLLEVGDAED